MAKALIALTVWLCLALPAFAAQSKTDVKKPVRPAWSELSPAQQKVLAPLSTEWDHMVATRRKKWVAIADRYPKMKPHEQQRLQKNMTDWVRLTPAQRKAARDKYQTMRKLPPKKRREVAAQWRRYQQSLAAQPEISPSDPPAPPEDPQSGEAPVTAPAAPGTATAGSPPPAPQ
jgi:hypothetical protein